MTETRSLHRKLAQIMHEAERIPKNGHAPQAMGGYPFVQVGDAADFVRKALAEQVLTMMPTGLRVIQQVDRPTKAGGSMTTVDIVMDWTITDGDSGESIVIQSFGAGADGGDKYSGKAQTNAMKYALLTGFLLSTGDDPELGTDSPARATQRAAAPVTAPTAQPTAPRPAAPVAQQDDDAASFDALVTQNSATLRPAPQHGSQVAPTCPVHTWDDEPRPMKFLRGEWKCTARDSNSPSGYCQESRPA